MHWATDFHREIVSEMGELGVLGPAIKGKPEQSYYHVTQNKLVIEDFVSKAIDLFCSILKIFMHFLFFPLLASTSTTYL